MMNTRTEQELRGLIQKAAGDKAALEEVPAGVRDLPFAERFTVKETALKKVPAR